MIPDDDSDLRERFAALRREEQRNVPGFLGMLGNARRPPRTRRVLPSAAVLATAAAVLAVLALLPLRERQGPREAPSIAEWKSPTDFLLATPGRDLLTTLPQFGVAPIDVSPGP